MIRDVSLLQAYVSCSVSWMYLVFTSGMKFLKHGA